MIDHIYGRADVLSDGRRPHMFIKELSLYMNYLFGLLNSPRISMDRKQEKYIKSFYGNMIDGIGYYRELIGQMNLEVFSMKENMMEELEFAEKRLKNTYQFHFHESLGHSVAP